jgi:hypothetical protein
MSYSTAGGLWRGLLSASRGRRCLSTPSTEGGHDAHRPRLAAHGGVLPRRACEDEPDNGLHLSGIRQQIESIFWTLKDRLGLERHRAKTLHGLRNRIAAKPLALATGVWLNRYLDRPTRAFAALAT